LPFSPLFSARSRSDGFTDSGSGVRGGHDGSAFHEGAFARPGREDPKGELYAILKFGIVTIIVLPLLPDRAFGPFNVVNPRVVWWMVVLISAVSMLGYVLMRFMGREPGLP